MKFEVLAVAMFFCLAGGVTLARLVAARRERSLIVRRLSRYACACLPALPPALVRLPNEQRMPRIFRALGELSLPDEFLLRCGYGRRRTDILLLSVVLPLLAVFAGFVLSVHPLAIFLLALCLAGAPWMYLAVRAGRRRLKFSEQLPDAIDLMVSVLRSGHSVPKAVKAVAEEVPAPCGAEFAEVVQRMNLGQPLYEALSYSAERFLSYELDLIRRAVAIQAEVGGSLAELLDKTNWTLRQRLKLRRQVRVLTAQSKLTALIVATMPAVLAAALEYMSPGYLAPLLSTGFGRALLVAAFVLEVLGLLVMRRLATVKV